MIMDGSFPRDGKLYSQVIEIRTGSGKLGLDNSPKNKRHEVKAVCNGSIE